MELSWPTYTLLAAITSVTLYWIYWRWSNRRLLELAAIVPGPPALPLIGNALIFLANPEDLLDVISSLIRKYGHYVKFWLGPELNICVKNPADIRLLLTSNKVNQKGPLYDIMATYIGPGILTGGPTWRHHRKIATPSYSKKSVIHYAEVFNREADMLTQVLLRKDPSVTYNVFEDVLEATTQSVCQTLMGLSKEDSQNVRSIKEVMRETQNMYTLIFTKMTRWWYHIPIIYRLIGAKKKEDYFIRLIDEMSSDIVNKRRKSIAMRRGLKKQTPGDDDEVMGIVDRYILCGELSEQEVKWETFSLFTTSQEASAKIASALLLFLAHLPDWQEKVYQEIIETLGPEDRPVSDEELKRLKHLDMVYKEVLRYLSIAAMIQRTVEQEVTINNGKLTLPAGTSLAIPIHELHRDPQYWTEPERVMPERFLPENVSARDPNAFVPFSLGAMDCLGRVYATCLIKTLAVKVVRTLQLHAEGRLEDLELHVAISVKFHQGYRLRTTPRHPITKTNSNGFKRH